MQDELAIRLDLQDVGVGSGTRLLDEYLHSVGERLRTDSAHRRDRVIGAETRVALDERTGRKWA